ncbi:MAG: glycosyltransferase family 39 protein [Anaerolineae bacterium]|nr:glycosyltransferase family 39 protein [Anaerolineae bacterium]
MGHLLTPSGRVIVHVHRPRSLELALIVLILLAAAGLRIADLTRLPPGFNGEELINIQIAETVRMGRIFTFYNLGPQIGGYEGLFPILQSVITTLVGDGLLFYRVLPLWCGLFSVALMYRLARRLYGPAAGLGAAIALTVTLWPVLLSRSTIREALLLPIILSLLLIMIRALHLSRNIGPEAPVTFSYTMLGVMLSLAIYTHWTGVVGGPIFLLFLGYLIVTRQPISRRVIGFSAFAFLVATILGIPYLTFTLRRLSWSGFYSFWINRPDNIGMLISSSFKTLASLAFVGDPSPQHNLSGLPLLGPVGVILLVVGLVVAARRWRWPNMLLMLLTLVVGLLPAMWARTAPNFANQIVALPAIMALVGLGASVIIEQILSRRATLNGHIGSLIHARVFLTLLIALALGTLSIRDLLFQQWANSNRVDMAYNGRLGRLAAYLDRANDGLSTSICSLNLHGDGEPSDPVLLDLMLHRRNVDIRFSDCLTGLVLTRGGAHQRFAYADIGGKKALSPIFREWLAYSFPVDVPGLPLGSVTGFDVEKELADLTGKLTLSHVEYDPTTSGASPVVELPVRMGGYLTFEGYTYTTGTTYKPGDIVSLVTYWRVDGPQDPDLRIFAHVLNHPNTEPIAQNDIISVDPTTLRDRDVFIQIINIPLPKPFPAGEYRVSVGAYHDTTKTRLPIYDASQERGDRLFLSAITVKEAD